MVVPLVPSHDEGVPPLGTVAVVGASLAGLRACESLRREGFAGTIVLVGDEHHLPYDRPPLSKQYLAGTWELDRVRLRNRASIDDLGLELRLGVRASGLDVGHRTVTLEDGTGLAYDGLVVASGAVARRWPTPVPAGVVVLRSLEDADVLRSGLESPGTRLVVVGGGFLGMEVAATARGRGLEVTVVEPLATPLGRVVGPLIGAAVRTLHERHGVTVRAGVGVEGFSGAAHVEAVRLDDGTSVPADLVLVAIGAEPATDWLEGSGLALDRGLLCEATLLAGPNVAAAGDVARFPHELAEAPVRLEHWTNAAEQGLHAGRVLLAPRGDAPVFRSVPYFWSDQYDVKIQAIGLPGPDDEVVVVDGSIDEGRFVACYGREGRLIAALGFGRPRQLMAFRPLLESDATLADARMVLA